MRLFCLSALLAASLLAAAQEATPDAYRRADDRLCLPALRVTLAPNVLCPRTDLDGWHEPAGGLAIEAAYALPLTQRCPLYLDIAALAILHVKGTVDYDRDEDDFSDWLRNSFPPGDPRRDLDGDHLYLARYGLRDDGRSGHNAWSVEMPVRVAYQVRGRRHPTFAFIPALGVNLKVNVRRKLYADFPDGWGYGIKPAQFGLDISTAWRMRNFYMALDCQPDLTPFARRRLYPTVETMTFRLAMGAMIDLARR